jgi:hypothetical protein
MHGGQENVVKPPTPFKKVPGWRFTSNGPQPFASLPNATVLCGPQRSSAMEAM